MKERAFYPHDPRPPISEPAILSAFVIHWLLIVALLVLLTHERVARRRAESCWRSGANDVTTCVEVDHGR